MRRYFYITIFSVKCFGEIFAERSFSKVNFFPDADPIHSDVFCVDAEFHGKWAIG